MYNEFIISAVFCVFGGLGMTEIIHRNVTKLVTIVKIITATEKNPIIVAYRVADLTYQAMTIKLDDEDVKVGKNLYEISYTLTGKKYKMLVRVKRGPCPIESIRDEADNDITELVLPYMGPSFDWYGERPPRPEVFGCKKLTIENSNGRFETIE